MRVGWNVTQASDVRKTNSMTCRTLGRPAQSAALFRLARACAVCQTGLRTAASIVESESVRRSLVARAKLWQHLLDELAGIAGHAEMELSLSQDTTGVLHRAWIKIKSGTDDVPAIRAACADREAFALQICQYVLDETDANPGRTVVARFFRKLRKSRLI